MNNQSSDSPLQQTKWNPYYVGIGIGILSWLAFLLVNKPIGMSTEVSKLSGWFASLFVGMETVTNNEYWASKSPAFGYSTLFLIFTFLGSGFSAWKSNDIKLQIIPSVWEKHQGSSPAKRLIAAFIGGFILLFGARMAGGCTSGHGISGTMQLALSSWIFFAVMFSSGLITAKIIFQKKI
jgi:hypothetical protein